MRRGKFPQFAPGALKLALKLANPLRWPAVGMLPCPAAGHAETRACCLHLAVVVQSGEQGCFKRRHDSPFPGMQKDHRILSTVVLMTL